mmetsp:Transcript_11188/g.36846  ORF Transcript_11188/g.36846 Transcript_11188/m.36846 type:complete len:261 (+) Transcript_11188:88-870(+)
MTTSAGRAGGAQPSSPWVDTTHTRTTLSPRRIRWRRSSGACRRSSRISAPSLTRQYPRATDPTKQPWGKSHARGARTAPAKVLSAPRSLQRRAPTSELGCTFWVQRAPLHARARSRGSTRPCSRRSRARRRSRRSAPERARRSRATQPRFRRPRPRPRRGAARASSATAATAPAAAVGAAPHSCAPPKSTPKPKRPPHRSPPGAAPPSLHDPHPPHNPRSRSLYEQQYINDKYDGNNLVNSPAVSSSREVLLEKSCPQRS